MVNNENINKNNKIESLEELQIPKWVAEFAWDKINKSLFTGWGRLNCHILKPRHCEIIRVLLKGENDEENQEILEQMLEKLKEVEDKISSKNDAENGGKSKRELKLTYRMLIPEQKCGYVVGKGFGLLNKIKIDCGLESAHLDKDEEKTIPGFVPLILHPEKVEGLRQARKEIGQLLRKALLNINPMGPAKGKRLSADGEGILREQVKFPKISKLCPWQKELNQQIVDFTKESGIQFERISDEFVELEGKWNEVIELKKRMKKLMVTLDLTTPSAHILVPFPNFRWIFGTKGEKIELLKTQFKVNLIFLGDNDKEYKEGRWLQIVGETQKQVDEAKEHIEREFIEQSGQREHQMEGRQEFQLEMKLAEKVAAKLNDIKICHGLSNYEIGRLLPDGTQRVVIKGRRSVLKAVEEKLDAFSEELAKNEENLASEKSDSGTNSSKNEGSENRMVDAGKNWIKSKRYSERKFLANFSEANERKKSGVENGMAENSDEIKKMPPETMEFALKIVETLSSQYYQGYRLANLKIDFMEDHHFHPEEEAQKFGYKSLEKMLESEEMRSMVFWRDMKNGSPRIYKAKRMEIEDEIYKDQLAAHLGEKQRNIKKQRMFANVFGVENPQTSKMRRNYQQNGHNIEQRRNGQTRKFIGHSNNFNRSKSRSMDKNNASPKMDLIIENEKEEKWEKEDDEFEKWLMKDEKSSLAIPPKSENSSKISSDFVEEALDEMSLSEESERKKEKDEEIRILKESLADSNRKNAEYKHQIGEMRRKMACKKPKN